MCMFTWGAQQYICKAEWLLTLMHVYWYHHVYYMECIYKGGSYVLVCEQETQIKAVVIILG